MFIKNSKNKHPLPGSYNQIQIRFHNTFRIRLILAFAATYCIWGSTYLFIRFAVETLPPFFMAGVRFIVAGAILYVFSILKSGERPTFAHWKNAAIAGILMLGLAVGLVTWVETFVPSGLAALFMATVPLWMVLLEWLRYGRKPERKAVFGVLLGLVAIGLLVDPAKDFSDTGMGFTGSAALIIAAIAWAIGSLYSRAAALPKSGFLSAALQMLTGGAFLIFAGIATGETAADVGSFSLLSVLSMLYLIVFGSLIAMTAYFWLLKNTAPSKATTDTFVNPAIAVFLGWAFADEVISLNIMLALALVVVAVVLVMRSRTRVDEKVEQAEKDSQEVEEISL